MCTVKGAETKVLPPLSPSPTFPPACKTLVFLVFWVFWVFFSDKAHNYPSGPDLGLQERPAASVKLAAARYFQAGGVGSQSMALSEQLRTSSEPCRGVQ